MSQVAVSKASKLDGSTGISNVAIWKIEAGETTDLKADTLFKLSAALGCNPEWLRTGEGEPHKFTLPNNVVREATELLSTLSADKQAMILAAIKAIK